jgi:hypothetical protein
VDGWTDSWNEIQYCACKLHKLSNVLEQKPQKKVSKLSYESYHNIVLSARSQATEYSTWTKLDFVKTVKQRKLWLYMVQRMFGASGQIPHSI